MDGVKEDKFNLRACDSVSRNGSLELKLFCADCGREFKRIGYDIYWDTIILLHPKNPEFGKGCERSEKKYDFGAQGIVVSFPELDRSLEPKEKHGTASAT
jgi:hypothetical protein